MGRWTVTIQDELLQEAREALGTETGAETIRTALEETVRRKRLERALGHAGKIELDVDQEKLRQLRAEG